MTIMSAADPIPQKRINDSPSDATASRYAVSWGAILAGTLAASGASLVLLTLGSGLGLAIVSPWPGSGTSVTTFAVSAAIWLVVVQWLSSGLGGYVAGRLHAQAPGIHDDEVYFRDTAHGFLAWALSTLLVAVLFGAVLNTTVSGAGAAASSAANGIASVASRSAAATSAGMPIDYAVDILFRSAPAHDGNALGAALTSDQTLAENRAEAGRILVNGLASGQMSDADQNYLIHLVSASTGLSETDAHKRIDGLVAEWNQAKQKVQQGADTARKSAMSAALMTALALVVGAFIASAAGALGGLRRDAYRTIVRSGM